MAEKWNLMNPQGKEWNLLHLQNTRITLQVKVVLRWPITIWCTNLFSCHKRWKFWMQKLQCAKNGRSTRQSPHGNWRSQGPEGGCSRSTKRDKKKVHFATLMDICHLKHLEFITKLQKFKAESCSMVTLLKTTLEPTQSSLNKARLPRWLLLKVMDVIARLPDCTRQAADAVSAYTHVKFEDAPRLLEIPKSECSVVWIRLPRHTWPKSWTNIEGPVVPLERILYGRSFAGLLSERQFEEMLLKLGWGKSTELGMSVCSSKTRIILIGTRGWHQDGCKEAEFGSHVEEIDEKTWILINPHHFLTMYIWDVLNVNANLTKSLLRSLQTCLNHVSLLEQLKSYQVGKNLTKTVAWSYDMEGHARKCVEGYCELANTEVEQHYKVASPCLDDHQFKQEEVESVGELSEVCLHIVLTCL